MDRRKVHITKNEKGTVIVTGIGDYDLEKTLTSGQCFRFKKESFIWTVQSTDKVVKIIQRGDCLLFMSSIDDVANYWLDYLGVLDDYSKMPRVNNEFLMKAEQYSRGLRIMRQDPWETLVCFIISQRNNIPKIKTTVEKLCKACGRQIQFDGEVYYAFPTPKELEEGLKLHGPNLGLGYRLPYLKATAREVLEGNIDLKEMYAGEASYSEVMSKLMKLHGVGPKVANCVALFGLGHTEAFPVDVWISRIIDTYFNGYFNVEYFGEYAGIIQQYMFFYGRSLSEV